MTNFIDSLTLSGFEVFDKPTTIPLNRLTFLLGPNSAGKSAVEDALKILSELYGLGNKDTHMSAEPKHHLLSHFVRTALGTRNSTSQFDRLQNHWRRASEDIKDYAPQMQIGFSCQPTAMLLSTGMLFVDKWPADASVKETFDGFENEAEIITTFKLHIDEDVQTAGALSNVELSINGEAITRLIEGEKVGFNLQHLAFQYINWGNIFESSQKFDPLISIEDDWLWFNSAFVEGYRTFPKQDLLLTAHLYFLQLSEQQPSDSSIKHSLNDIPESLAELLEKFEFIYEDLFNAVLQDGLGGGLTQQTVPASRTIPIQCDLTFLIDEWKQGCFFQNVTFEQNLKAILNNPLHQFGLQETGDSQYLELAQSLINPNRDANSYADKVNEALANHLFRDMGYALAADSLIISDPHNQEKPVVGKLIKIHLVDAKGRQLLFSEVGSGLGYVLPILCAVYARTSISQHFNLLTLIHQPELHLHPALQSELADIFIEATSSDSQDDDTDSRDTHQPNKKYNQQIIVETHSEYLLLRLLKRVRQTHANKSVAKELEIKHDEISIVYFEPSPEGITKVKHIRVSEDGDFLDRWPKGFFAERDQDLFDE